MVDCSEKLRALRIARGLTQKQLADRLGLSKASISGYETAIKAPSLEIIVRLSAFFRVSTDYLLTVDSPKTLDVSGLSPEDVALLSAMAERMRQKEPE